ncbi:alpha/beta fold hydrolase [Pseudoalteromonas sp. MMG005]|uniref:alpha/beta hydrolase n=1 Tax=Pseudoalteromonas sp. MMG005 TaxID=2822682 RepID=UPI001B3A678E|nr:alpha/beta fold hydrolase [Pseudoalteromonas sp. MMG005]MBQ4848427.1 alpha/beta fold hydrolase [Pseudoalteromonas sp. MMG005]
MNNTLFFGFALLLLSSGESHAQAHIVDCVSLNINMKHIESLADSGQYRQTLEPEKKPFFDFSKQGPFSDYVEYERNRILAENPKGRLPCPIATSVSTHLYGDKSLQVVDLISPFQLNAPKNKSEPTHRGVLLIHGLTDSPYLFHDLAEQFFQQGITVRTLLLPGHGTAPSALVDVSQQQWRIATRYAVAAMLEDFDTVYLGGFSTGGALLIDYLNQHDLTVAEEAKIKGLMLWSPASRAKSSMAWAAQYMAWFKDYMESSGDIDFAKYESFPFNAAAQVRNLMQRIQPEKLAYVPDIPLFLVAAQADQTIDTQSTLSLLTHWHLSGARKSKEQDTLIYYGENAWLKSLPRSITVYNPTECRGDDYCGSIKGISHTATTNAPTNPHYGWGGTYRSCEHLMGTDNYRVCKQTDTPILGETTVETLHDTPQLQRLTFNPYFEQMTDALTQFIKTTQ